MDTNFEKVADSIFGKTNPFLCKWENLKLASDKGAVKTNFVFHTNHFKTLIKDKSNNTFFQGLISTKMVVIIAWTIYYLVTTLDFWFLLTLPISFVFGFAIEYFWYRRFLLTIVTIAVIVSLGKYFNLNIHYYLFLSFIIFISSQIHSVYNTFLTQLFYADPKNFAIGIDEQYIQEIYDGMKGVKHHGPFFMHKI
jgi:hypothetical protein